MATFTKRGTRWSAQIRRKGLPAQSRTFSTKGEAKAWAAAEEVRLDCGGAPPLRQHLGRITVGDLIDRYLVDVTAHKRGASSERLRLKKMRLAPIASVTLLELGSSHIAQYRDNRLTEVMPATVHREMAIIQHMLEVARREWDIRLPDNPAKLVRPPKVQNARDRRLEDGEQRRLLLAVAASRNVDLLPLVQLAIETGMRRGELLNLAWEHVDLKQGTAHIPLTKTGLPRTIPLTQEARTILRGRSPAASGLVFCVSGNAIRLAWKRAIMRANLRDLRFHDLRHEAVSRFFELGLSVPEVALISGHRDPRMLFRYTHVRPTALAAKLKSLNRVAP